MPSASPPVSCRECARTWNSATMVEGLRLLGSCPRCGGILDFQDAEAPAGATRSPGAGSEVAPHLVLGLPRR